MSKRILIISSSFRRGGNSDQLADEFARGAKEAGNEVEKICLADKKIEFCRGCVVCQNTKRCVIHDDMRDVLEKMRNFEVLVFATPIYYYEMSGQMKTFLDRTNPLYTDEYDFRDIYLLTTSADEDLKSIDGAKKGLEGWIYCFEKTSLKGVVHAGGVDKKGDISKYSELLMSAYEMGRIID